MLRKKPFFRAEPWQLFDVNEGRAKQFAEKYRIELLAKGFPARTLPAGANPFRAIRDVQIIKSQDMAEEFKTDDSRWPRQGDHPQTRKRNSWLHSDFKNIAYPHNYKLYDFIIEKGDLK